MSLPSEHHQSVAILDFGSQYSHLIARRVREAGVYCELLSHDVSLAKLREKLPGLKGVILSGGPASVYEEGSPRFAAGLLDGLDVPVLGICYGFQLMTQVLGGKVVPGEKKEYGHADLRPDLSSPLFHSQAAVLPVWMSHGDRVEQLAPGFSDIAATDNAPHAAASHSDRQLYGLQFHPEVTHTPCGTQLIRDFVREICGCLGDWTMAEFVEEATREIRERVGAGTVIGAVSGGVDSTVAAVLLTRAIGPQFKGILVDNGLLRKDEAEEVLERLKTKCGVDIAFHDASEMFLKRLDDVNEPEQKRKIIGNSFIEVFEAEASKCDAQFLLQGTLYPDVIESVSHKGPSATIKTHHNVGGLPEHMKLELIEPLRFLFKDEVRQLGLVLGIEHDSVYRHPFPGPGLGIRVLGKLTPQRLHNAREADAIFISELRAAGLYHEIGQAFVVLLPCKSVGVMGDGRTYEEVVALRAVSTTDYMTADWFDIPTPLLRKISTRIVNEIAGINRCTYDITSKPPGTIEWE